MRLMGLLLLLGSFAVLGCGGQRSTTERVTPPTPQEQIKGVLDGFAQSGAVDSGLMIVREQAEKLKQSDPAKAEALLKGADELESLGDPEAIKAKAKELADGL